MGSLSSLSAGLNTGLSSLGGVGGLGGLGGVRSGLSGGLGGLTAGLSTALTSPNSLVSGKKIRNKPPLFHLSKLVSFYIPAWGVP